MVLRTPHREHLSEHGLIESGIQENTALKVLPSRPFDQDALVKYHLVTEVLSGRSHAHWEGLRSKDSNVFILF